MTFKTDTKFDESPVLRSLERVAVGKGLVTPDPITKEASVGESYAPTDDLHEDMLRLVSGLRAKGFTKEADALEDNINTRKFAETHLYRAIDEDGDDLLDFAHPDGDVEIAPTTSGLGKVWTEQSAKKEILRIVNKQPTGKNASRGTNIKKVAQEADEDAINSAIASHFDDIDVAKGEAIKGLGAKGSSWEFREDGVLSDSVAQATYLELSGVTSDALNGYKKLVKLAYGGTQIGTANDIFNRLKAIGVGSYNEWYTVTGLDFFWGSQPYTKDWTKWDNPKPTNAAWSRDNPNSIIKWFSWGVKGSNWVADPGKMSAAANAVHQLVGQKRAAVFGENLGTATAAFKKKASAFEGLVNSAFGALSVPTLERDENDSLVSSASAIIAGTRALGSKIKSLGAGGTFQKRYNRLVAKIGEKATMNWDSFDGAIQKAQESLLAIATLLAPLVKGGPSRVAAKNFQQAAGIFGSYMQQHDPGSQEFANAQARRAQSASYANKILSGIKKGKMERVYKFFGADSAATLLAVSQQWLANTQKMTGLDAPTPRAPEAPAPAPKSELQKGIEALRGQSLPPRPDLGPADDDVYASSKNDDMTKVGQFNPDPSAVKATPPSGKAPAKPGAGKGSGMKQQPRGATGNIQQALLDLAAYIEASKGHPNVIKILKMEPHGRDNMWGDDTEKALKVAEDVRKKYAPKSPVIEVKNTTTTVTNLKALLTALKSGAGSGMQQQQGTLYDKVPNVLDTSTLTRTDGTIDTTSASFASLAVFHAFLLGNGLMQQEFAQGQEMVYSKKLQDALLWFQKRSQWIAAQQKDPKTRQASISYRRDVAKVIRQFITLINSLTAKYGQLPTWVPVDYLSNEQYAGPGAAATAGEGSGMKQRGGAGGDLRIELIGGEAGAIPATDSPPVTRYIDLSENWWDLPEKFLLDFNTVGRMSGANFATTYFSDDPGPRKPTLTEAARAAGYRPEQIRTIEGKVMLYPWGKRQRVPEAYSATGGWVPAESNRWVQAKMNVPVAADDPNTRALNFIREIRREITSVFNAWSEGVKGPKMRRQLIPLISRDVGTWQKKFTRMENDIGKTNRRERRR